MGNALSCCPFRRTKRAARNTPEEKNVQQPAYSNVSKAEVKATSPGFGGGYKSSSARYPNYTTGNNSGGAAYGAMAEATAAAIVVVMVAVMAEAAVTVGVAAAVVAEAEMVAEAAAVVEEMVVANTE
ncbi:hypothetical protein COEREDRAFT_80562 [Coemansia reversa NRRL 1564]|uniref:Uncharacterized protein n=1 Tax=Coemansia reversa (strain ATCC 12441 / NRRL 1564) TaxID=763665 RepID=A0A2G5BDW0_COERN|nr:hypothetical protein COEREDRAFT_80562 [Coemansia reversa NRRL 1564]|eukprot:PIA17195.1 hypothetical protein COEREDRAFT_80562 [Coemansia reversa NRRL 1564]